MKFRFKNRIAFYNTLAAATSTLLVFVAVYLVVFQTAYQHLDADIRQEKTTIWNNLDIQDNQMSVVHSLEWDEAEHQQVEVNPTFIQITNQDRGLVFHSANLKNAYLKIDPTLQKEAFFETEMNGERIRLGQFPVISAAGKLLGHVSIGVSLTESTLVLHNLRLTLLIAYPFLLIIIYWASSLAAARGIAPIHQLIQTARQIDEQHLETRLPLPPRRDEIYQLATTINELLGRIENSIRREKQVTADISHELRTPLAGIRGTIEVLLRRRREPIHYEEKMQYLLLETDRMNQLLEQLLQLSRIEAGIVKPQLSQVHLQTFMEDAIEKWQPFFDEKQQTVQVQIPGGLIITTDATLMGVVVDNLVSNAIKYGRQNGLFEIKWEPSSNTLSFHDDGPGIPPEKLAYVFDRFYRADDSRNAKVPGTGLGLSISRKLAELLGAQISVRSDAHNGTVFLLQLPAF